MPNRLDQLAEEGALALRRYNSDLLALLALPATWRGQTPQEITASLLGVLVNLLRLDVALVRVVGHDGTLEHRFPVDLDVEGLTAALRRTTPPEPALFTLPRTNVLGSDQARLVAVNPLGELGTVVVGSWRANFPTTHESILLRTAVDLASLSIQSAREAQAYAAERQARAAAERLAHQARRLERFTARMTASLSVAQIADVMLRDGAQMLGAIGGALWRVESDGRFALVASSGFDALGPASPVEHDAVAGVVRERRPLWPDEDEARGTGPRAVFLPIAIEDRSLGAVSFAFAGARALGEDDRAFLLVATQHCAHALERARLLEAERRAATEARQAYGLAREAERRKDEFLAMLGHELRNPLAPITTALQLVKLRAGGRLDREHAIIERQLGQLERLVNDLLDVSRITSGKVALKRERVALADVVAAALETAQPLLERNRHRLEVAVPPDGLSVDADRIRLAQVITNLLTNSAKYTEPGGRIAIVARAAGNEAVLTVHDTGSGIAPELLPNVFDLFVQAPQNLARSEGGLGLGLTLVKHIVEMHGGTVSAFSAGLGRGSEFTVRLPLARAMAGASPAAPAAHEGADAQGPRRRVLVVDDNRDAAELTAEALRLAGHEVSVAHDGASALALARQTRPDVVLLDVGLPLLDGYQVAERLRTEVLAGVPVRIVAMTGYGQDRDRTRALAAGCDDHLTKPVDLERLFAAVV